jgi:hypothetical protein
MEISPSNFSRHKNPHFYQLYFILLLISTFVLNNMPSLQGITFSSLNCNSLNPLMGGSLERGYRVASGHTRPTYLGRE